MVVDLKMLAMIFIINFAYITLNTIRFMLTMKGYRVIAPLVSMAEITIYVLGLSMVLNRLDNPLNLLVYALGYAVGISVGIKIEDYLALGYIMVSVILPSTTEQFHLPETLREHGYGVTQSVAHGREGERMVLEILSPRKNERTLYKLINQLEPRAFPMSLSSFPVVFGRKKFAKEMTPFLTKKRRHFLLLIFSLHNKIIVTLIYSKIT